MTYLDPALGGFGYPQGSNMFDLRPEFGQTSGRYRYDPGGFPGYHSYPFGYALASRGTPMPPFYTNPSFFGFTGGTFAPGHTSHPFGFTPTSGGTPVPTFGHNNHPFGFYSSDGGSFEPTFGQNITTLFGFPPANGGTSVPTYGQNSIPPFRFPPDNGGTSVLSYGQNSTTPFGCDPANGGTSAPMFGQNSIPPFGFSDANGGTSMPTFGQSSNASRCALIYGGTSSTDCFGFTPSNTTSVPAWQSSNSLGSVPTNGGTPATTFGEGRNSFASELTNGGSSVPACGASLLTTLMQTAPSSPIRGSLSGYTSFSQTPAVNASSSPGFSFDCTMTCGQPTLLSGTSSLFGTVPYLSGTQNDLSGSTAHLPGDQVKTPVFWGPGSGPFTNHGGSRVTPYTETVEREAGSQLSARLMSISAMPVFRDKCHEELRWEDKQLGDDGNIPLFHSVRSGQSAIGSQSKGSKVKPYTKTMVGEEGSRATSISAMPVYQDKSHEELRWEEHQFNNAGGEVDPASEQLNCLWNPVSRTCSSFLNDMPSYIPPNIFASKPPCFTFPTCSTSFTSNSVLNDPCGVTYTSTAETPSIYGSAIRFSHPNPSISSASARKASTSGPGSFNYTSSAPVVASVPCNFPPSIFPLGAVLPPRCRSETPPAVPQMSAEGPKATSVRYGISSIPVKHSANEEQKQLLTPKCNCKGDGTEVAFSADAHETPTTAREKVPLLPKDNSGVLISGPSEEWTLRINFENTSHIKHTSIHVYENGEVSVKLSKPLADSSMQDEVVNPVETFAAEHSLKPNSVNGNHTSGEEVPSNVSWLLPKLKHSDYYIQPRVEELAIKERFEPGFCSHVKDFVVGHKRYGCIKFLGETDVRQFDVNSHVVFRNHEVILSMDENKKPQGGQGLNKAAEITLRNIKCVDKAGSQHIRGPKVDKYEKELMKKAAEQGAEFVSYDPVQGEWKFRVKHI